MTRLWAMLAGARMTHSLLTCVMLHFWLIEFGTRQMLRDTHRNGTPLDRGVPPPLPQWAPSKPAQDATACQENQITSD